MHITTSLLNDGPIPSITSSPSIPPSPSIPSQEIDPTLVSSPSSNSVPTLSSASNAVIPSNINTSSSSSTHTPRIPLFDLSLPPKLELDQVYWNGLHTLHRFEIRNITSDPIRIKLKSNMGSQIAFQLTNENLPELDTEMMNFSSLDLTSSPLSLSNTTNTMTRFSPSHSIPPPTTLSHSYSVSALNSNDGFDTFSSSFPVSSSVSLTSSSSTFPSTSLPELSTESSLSSFNQSQSSLSYTFSPLKSSQITSIPPSPNVSSSSSTAPFEPSSLPLPSFSTTSNLSTLPFISTTNTASAAALGAYASGHGGYEFNQLFNYVNHIDELTLEGYETRQLILAYLPNPVPDQTTLPKLEEFNDSISYDFQLITGMLFFYGYKTLGSMLKPDYHIPIKFKARICKSFLFTEVSHHGLVFEECLVNTTTIRDFTIWNKSEIDLYFVLNTAEVPPSLIFSDYNTGEVLNTTKRIPSYSHCRVRVTFKPTLVGDFFYEVQLENVNDASNVELIRIHCVVRSALNEASLILVEGNSLDFGDVCAGQCHTSKLILKNVSENPLDIHLSAEGAKVLFDVLHPQQEPLFMDPVEEEPSLPNSNKSKPAILDTVSTVLLPMNPQTTTTFPSNLNNPTHLSGNATMITKPSTPIHEPQAFTSSFACSPLLPPSSTTTHFTPLASMHPTLSLSLDSTVPDLNRTSFIVHSFSNHLDPEEEYPDSDSASSSSTRSHGNWGFLLPELTNTPPRHTYHPPTTSLDATTRGPHHIDEIVLKPGLERHVLVWYYPEKSLQEDYNAACLIQKSFRLFLQYGKERKVIQCKARVCTSFITVSPSILSFGDTDVGTLKSLPIKITNASEIQAKVQLSFASKVLSCPKNELFIPPRQSIHVKIDIFPRKVNPDYRKEITVVNLLNQDNNCIVEVRSTNLDTQRITWHSLFYRIMTPSSTNFLDFGSVVGNFFALRTFTVQNVSKKELVLNITSSSEYLSLYYKNPSGKKVPLIPKLSSSNTMPTSTITASDLRSTHLHSPNVLTSSSTSPILPLPPSPSTSSTLLLPSSLTSSPSTATTPTTITSTTTTSSSTIKDKKQVLETMADRKPIKRTNSDNLPNTTPEYLDLALPKKQPILKQVHTHRYDMVHSIDDILRLCQQINVTNLTTFPPPAMEHKFIKLIMMLKESLTAAIQDQLLLPVTEQLHVPAEKEMEFIAVLRAPMIKERRKKLDGRLTFALLDYDPVLLPKMQSHLPVREFLTRCILCPSVMEVAQRNINFGVVELQSELKKAILIRNKSDVPLLFAMKKSGSIASGDIVIDHRLGMIPPHGSKEVDFVFQPSMPGSYFEKIIVENVQNSENIQLVSLKANVRKMHTFNIHSEAIDFGLCLANELSSPQFITLQNTDKKQPHLFTFRVQEEETNGSLQFEFSVLSSETMGHTTEDVEEKLESLEQKLKIAKRKGHQEKVEKINETISELRRKEMVVTAFQGDANSIHTSTPIPTEKKVDVLTLLVEPNTLKKIAVQVRPKPVPLIFSASPTSPTSFTTSEHHSTQSCQGFIYIHQHKNTDLLKKVAFSCLICYDPFSYRSPMDKGIPSSFAISSTHLVSHLHTTNLNHDVIFSPSFSALSDPLSTLALETPTVDLGKLFLFQEAPFYFVLINRHGTEANPYYVTLDSNMSLLESEGIVLPNQRKVINANLIPQQSGKQTFPIRIVSLNACLIFTLHYLGVYKDAFILKKENQITQDINLGYCYNTKKNLARAVFELQSTVPEILKVTAISTLAQQASVFLDPYCSLPCSDTLIEPKQIISVYFSLQPNLLPLPMGTIKKGSPSCLSRPLVGGFKFTGINMNGDEVCSQNIRFQAMIGHSLFQVNPNYLNLGYIDTLQPVHATVTISNLSDKMPLDFKVTSTSPDLITLHYPKSHLIGYEDENNQETSDELSLSKSIVQVTFSPTHVGYYHEQLMVTNLNCPDSITSIQSALFVDPHKLQLTTSSNLVANSCSSDTKPFLLLQWDPVYVFTTLEKKLVLAETSVNVYETLTLTNTTNSTLTLFAQSNIDVYVHIHSSSSVDSLLSSSASLLFSPPKALSPTSSSSSPSSESFFSSWTRCSPIFKLNPNEAVTCEIHAPFLPSQVSEESMLNLNQGKKIKTRGVLAFCGGASDHFLPSQVLKVLELQAFFCIAKGEILQSKPLQFKVKKGDIIQFTTSVKNTAMCPLHLTLHLPPCIRFESSTIVSLPVPTLISSTSSPVSISSSNLPKSKVILPSLQTSDFLFSLDTSGLAGGHHEYALNFKNIHNSFNTMSLPVCLDVTCLDLTISGGDLDENQVLDLPSISVPSFISDFSCDAWFNLTNMSSSEVRFTVAVELIQPLSEWIQLFVLSRFSNSPLNWITLPGNGSIEVKVKGIVFETAKLIKQTCPKWILDERGVHLGKVFIENENGNMTIPLRGKLIEQICFQLDVNVLDVTLDVPTEIHITNLSPYHALTLSTQLEMLHELDSIQLLLPSQVSLGPSNICKLPIVLEKSEFLESGDILLIHFEDQDSVTSLKKSVKLRLCEPQIHKTDPSLLIPSSIPTLANDTFSNLESNLMDQDEDIIVIKGCIKKEKVYELDLGQQDLGASSNLTRKISLELNQLVPCRFVVKTIPSDISDWFTFNKTEGWLNPVTQKSQSILFTFAPSIRNVYVAYVVIENLDYPLDLKWIKVNLEVVGKANPKKMRPFHLVVPGMSKEDPPIIRYEDVYYGNEYITRSFRIYNRESIPLEFSLNIQHLSPPDETQVLFSNSMSSPVLLKDVTVPPESFSQVYLRFYPAPGNLDSNPESIETKQFEIQIHSRLIRDYMQTVSVIATCWFPRIQVSTTKLLFTAAPYFLHYNMDPFSFKSSSSLNAVSSSTVIPMEAASSSASITATTTPGPTNSSSSFSSPLQSPLPSRLSMTPLVQLKEVLEGLSKDFTISNLHLSRYVPIVILNDTSYFEVTIAPASNSTHQEESEPISFPTLPPPLDTSSSSSSSSPSLRSLASSNQLITLEQDLQPGQHLTLRVRVKMESLWICLDRLKREKYIQETLMIYHRRFPTEHFWLTLNLSLGPLEDFTWIHGSISGSWSQKWVSLETQIYHFLRSIQSNSMDTKEERFIDEKTMEQKNNMNVYKGLTSSFYVKQKKLTLVSTLPVSFDFALHVIVDQLVYFATTTSSGSSLNQVFLLAGLFFTSLLTHPLNGKVSFTEVQRYGRYFLSFFIPSQHPLIESLNQLYSTTTASSISPTSTSVHPTTNPLTSQ